MATKVSVVIPTKNGGALFLELLERLRSQKVTSDYELIVIDSGSTDSTIENAAAFGAKIYQIEPSAFNHGATRNLGVGKTQSEFIVLMTQDAIPADDYLLDEIVKPFYENPNIAGVYARQSPRPEADVLTKRNLNGWLTGRDKPELKKIENEFEYNAWHPIERYFFCNFDNVCSAIRRTAWNDIPFNAIAFGEDIDWSKRALESGWSIMYTPKAHVIHSHDRPISYEYKRTYMCHQTLYRLFDVRTVPSLKHAIKSISHAIASDFRYLYKQPIGIKEKCLMSIKIPALAVASVWGQYRGAHEEHQNRGRKMADV